MIDELKPDSHFTGVWGGRGAGNDPEGGIAIAA